MPAYTQSSVAEPINSLYPGMIGLSADAEVGTGAKKAFVVANRGGDGQNKSVSLEVSCDADPGTFEAHLQAANTDVDAAYADIDSTGITDAQLNTGFYGLEAVTPAPYKFYRVNIESNENDAAVTAKLYISA